MTPETNLQEYNLCLMSDMKDDKVEPNRIYMGIDRSINSLCYKVLTPAGKEITTTIHANRLFPPIDLTKELKRETLALYQSQILKITAARGHIDNKLYVKQAKDGVLEYQVLTPEGKYVRDSILLRVKEPLTPQKLDELKGPILEITSQKKHTPLGRAVQGTLPQIAMMGGDIDIQAGIKKEKDRGALERLAIAAGLSQQQLADQLPDVMSVILSDEAKKINNERNQRIQTAVEKFGNDILKVNINGIMDIVDEELRLKTFQSRCQTEIDELEKKLQPNTEEVITSGYIFDPITLARAVEWFEKEEIQERFGDLSDPRSYVFRVVVYGMLEAKFSARDGHVARHGIGPVVKQEQIPLRTINNEIGSSYFNSSSGLGQELCLGYYGMNGLSFSGGSGLECWRDYVDQKQQRCEAYAAPRALNVMPARF